MLISFSPSSARAVWAWCWKGVWKVFKSKLVGKVTILRHLPNAWILTHLQQCVGKLSASVETNSLFFQQLFTEYKRFQVLEMCWNSNLFVFQQLVNKYNIWCSLVSVQQKIKWLLNLQHTTITSFFSSRNLLALF